METRDLQTFLAVVQAGSITGAAGLLGRSQPAVTRVIQELEAELGFALFHRLGRGIVPTEEGVAFEEEARRLLLSFTEIAARARALAAGRGGMLQVAATSAIGTGLIPGALARLGPDRLPAETQVAQYLPSSVAQEVRAGRAELGFSSLPLDQPGLEVLRLYAAPDVAALHADDPLASLETVPLAAFEGRRLVTMLDPLRFQAQIARAMAEQGIRPGPVIRTNVSAAALQMVRRTGIPALLEPVTAHGLALPGVVLRPLDTAVPFHWGVIAAPGRPLRPVARELVAAVEAEAQALIPGLVVLDPATLGTASLATASHSTTGPEKAGPEKAAPSLPPAPAPDQGKTR